MTANTVPSTESTPHKLSPIAEKLIEAVAAEIKGDVVARHKLNIVSPSFPLNHRSMANRDAIPGQGVKEFIMVGGRRFYSKSSLLEMLRTYLSKS